MTSLQLAIASGALFGVGVIVILWQILPGHPELSSALDRLAPERNRTMTPGAGITRQDRAGMWVLRQLPGGALTRLPRRELAMLRMPVHRYLGEKTLYGLLGLLLFPSVLSVSLAVIGVGLPFALTVLGGLLLGAAMTFIPDFNVHSSAKTARDEFTRALGAYIDLVALERSSSSGSTQALEAAAAIGDSWVFQRLREELARARWTGTPPWDGLADLAEELGLPELADLGDIMRLSGEQGGAVYATLRARAASLRMALLSAEHARANAIGERMTLPVSLLALIFLVLLAMPSVLRVVFGGT